jgi:trehalose 6-phosphate synthase
VSKLTGVSGSRAQLLHELLGEDGRLFIVSNRGPITFTEDPEAPEGLSASRGSGGLVTALAELGGHVPATWIAAAISRGDRRAAPELARSHRRLSSIRAADRKLAGRVRDLTEEILPGQDLRLHYHPIPDDVYTAYYETVSNPFLWFLQHQMYALPYVTVVDLCGASVATTIMGNDAKALRQKEQQLRVPVIG